MDIKEVIQSDLYRLEKSMTAKSLIKRLRIDPCFRFLFFFRYASKYPKKSLIGLIVHYFYKKYSVKYGIQIPKSVKIGKGFVMLHQGGIVVNSQTEIGNNCTLMHNTTLGNTKSGKFIGAPKIGNRVYIGPGAVIIGAIDVGDNVLIAPNSFVNINVPSNSIVIGNPCKIISKENPVENYITNTFS